MFCVFFFLVSGRVVNFLNVYDSSHFLIAFNLQKTIPFPEIFAISKSTRHNPSPCVTRLPPCSAPLRLSLSFLVTGRVRVWASRWHWSAHHFSSVCPRFTISYNTLSI